MHKNHKLKLITESIDIKSLTQVLEESKSGEKTWKIKGPFLQAEVKNKNSRIYGRVLCEREVTKFQSKIQRGNAWGELDHPPTPNVNGQNTAILISDLRMDKNTGLGEAIVLDTVQGKNVQAMMKYGTVGMSTRGIGTLKGENVNDDFNLITSDVVTDPSGQDCYVQGILESKEFIVNGDQIMEATMYNFEENLKNKGKRSLDSIFREYMQEIANAY